MKTLLLGLVLSGLVIGCNTPPQTGNSDAMLPADSILPDTSRDLPITPDLNTDAQVFADATAVEDGAGLNDAEISLDSMKVDTNIFDAMVIADGNKEGGQPDLLLADASCPASIANCPGAPLPTWSLEDFQPKSSDFGKSYGLSAFNGKVLIVAFLGGG
jgi:hypothetical protein